MEQLMSCAQAKESLLSFKGRSLKVSLLPSVHVGVGTPGGPTGVFGHFCQTCRMRKPGLVGWDVGLLWEKTSEGCWSRQKQKHIQCPKPMDHVSWIQPPHLLSGCAAHRAAIASTPGCPRRSTGPIPTTRLTPLLPDLYWQPRGGHCVLTAPSSWDWSCPARPGWKEGRKEVIAGF